MTKRKKNEFNFCLANAAKEIIKAQYIENSEELKKIVELINKEFKED